VAYLSGFQSNSTINGCWWVYSPDPANNPLAREVMVQVDGIQYIEANNDHSSCWLYYAATNTSSSQAPYTLTGDAAAAFMADMETLFSSQNSGSGNSYTVQTIATSGSLVVSLVSDTLIEATGGSAGITLTLPSAINFSGEIMVVKMDDTLGEISIAAVSGQTVSGLSTYILNNQWQSISLVSDNSNWIVVALVD
jgi:hypothetical protein